MVIVNLFMLTNIYSEMNQNTDYAVTLFLIMLKSAIRKIQDKVLLLRIKTNFMKIHQKPFQRIRKTTSFGMSNKVIKVITKESALNKFAAKAIIRLLIIA